MKKILLILLITISIYSCKKTDLIDNTNIQLIPTNAYIIKSVISDEIIRYQTVMLVHKYIYSADRITNRYDTVKRQLVGYQYSPDTASSIIKKYPIGTKIYK